LVSQIPLPKHRDSKELIGAAKIGVGSGLGKGFRKYFLSLNQTKNPARSGIQSLENQV